MILSTFVYTTVLLLFAFAILLPFDVVVDARGRYPDPKLKSKPRPKPPKLNIDILPPLQEIIEKLELQRYLKNFIKMGVTETRLLVRLTDMDFRLMSIEWDDITDEEILKLKNEVASLYNQAIVVEQDEFNPEMEERKKLNYGRVYIDNAVQSFEYLLGSFGGTPPANKLKLVIAPDTFACDLSSTAVGTDEQAAVPVNLTGTLLVAQRGNCTFLTKAINAHRSNASALVIVNTEDRLESPSSGLGIDRNVTDAMVLSVSNLPVLTFSNTSWEKILTAARFSPLQDVYANIVPLKCKSGGTCQALLPDEKALLPEISWGTLRLRDTMNSEVRSFEFVSSNFGATLPVESPVRVVLADPIDACSELQSVPKVNANDKEKEINTNTYAGAAVVVHRGSCRFDTKALSVQEKGGRLMIVVDVEDNALQRIGGMTPISGYVGIPSVIITAVGGEFINKAAATATDAEPLIAEFIPATDSSGADKWIEVAFSTWSEDEDKKLIQLEGLVQKYSQSQSAEIVAWLHRRIDEITAPIKKNMDTDEL